LAAVTGFRVGIAWQGNPAHKGDRRRSMPLTCFEPLAQLPGVQLLSLQKGLGVEQLPAVTDRFSVIDLGSQLGDFRDTAAVMMNLDLVVACDTAVVHLAGNLGIPAWVALPFAPDWCWLLQRTDTPWYPSLRLFRQPQPGDWATVFEEMRTAL
jgi:hypothetical protein